MVCIAIQCGMPEPVQELHWLLLYFLSQVITIHFDASFSFKIDGGDLARRVPRALRENHAPAGRAASAARQSSR